MAGSLARLCNFMLNAANIVTISSMPNEKSNICSKYSYLYLYTLRFCRKYTRLCFITYNHAVLNTGKQCSL